MNEENNNNNQRNTESLPFFSAPIEKTEESPNVQYNPAVLNKQENTNINTDGPRQNLTATYVPTETDGYNHIFREEDVTEDTIVREYMGENAYKIVGKTVNFSYMLFGVTYLFYRKMYLQAFAITLINVILGLSFQVLFPNLAMLAFLPTILISVIYSFRVNRAYYNTCVMRTRKIAFLNPEVTKRKLLTLCKKAGGTSIMSATFGTLFYSVAWNIFFIPNMLNSFNFNSTFSNDYEVDLTFNLDNYKFTNPSGFKRESTTVGQYTYKYIVDKKVKCTFTIEKVSSQTSSEAFADQYASYYNTLLKPDDPYNKMNELAGYNNKRWDVISNNKDAYIYFSNFEGGVLKINLHYNTDEREHTDSCRKSTVNFIKSLQIRS